MGSNGGKKSKNRPVLSKKTACSFHDFAVFSEEEQKRKVQQTRMFTGLSGGELGIRTLGPFRDTAFRVFSTNITLSGFSVTFRSSCPRKKASHIKAFWRSTLKNADFPMGSNK
ncbi:MAG: hypothetical protein ACOX85_10990 [Candidatus Pararuminococcus gallinarum]|jgi:hypothetical protein